MQFILSWVDKLKSAQVEGANLHQAQLSSAALTQASVQPAASLAGGWFIYVHHSQFLFLQSAILVLFTYPSQKSACGFQSPSQTIIKTLPDEPEGKGALQAPDLGYSQCFVAFEVSCDQGHRPHDALEFICVSSPGASIQRPLYLKAEAKIFGKTSMQSKTGKIHFEDMFPL